jgi:hypothetical protein
MIQTAEMVEMDCNCEPRADPLRLMRCQFQPYWATSYWPAHRLHCNRNWPLALEMFNWTLVGDDILIAQNDPWPGNNPANDSRVGECRLSG